MSAYRTPRAGTRPDIAFRRLIKLGRVDAKTWMAAINWTGTPAAFERDIINSLTRCHFVRVEAGLYAVTQRGRDAIGAPAGASTAESGQVAGPRYAGKAEPLAPANMVRAPLARPGSFDYAAIPSRMGNQRVPHSLAMPGTAGAAISE